MVGIDIKGLNTSYLGFNSISFKYWKLVEDAMKNSISQLQKVNGCVCRSGCHFSIIMMKCNHLLRVSRIFPLKTQWAVQSQENNLQHCNSKLCGDICFNLTQTPRHLIKQHWIVVLAMRKWMSVGRSGGGIPSLLTMWTSFKMISQMQERKRMSHHAACFTFVCGWESTTNLAAKKTLDKNPCPTHPIHKHNWKISHIWLLLQAQAGGCLVLALTAQHCWSSLI